MDKRLAALRRFALAITVLNLLGHAVLGFEGALVQWLASLLAAYGAELLLELVESRREGRAPGYRASMVDFLLPAHITGTACAMLLYANERVAPIVFASVAAIASKKLLRAEIAGRARHFMNPSNVGIGVTLLLFPWVGIAPPYQFTENLSGAGDWLLPILICCSGSFLNWRFTGRIPLILAWLIGFAAQASVRAVLFDVSVASTLIPMTGMAFLLFTFYMLSDPGTTPASRSGQIAFGLAAAASYGLLQVFHVVFGLFFALMLVCSVRGLGLLLERSVWALARRLTATQAQDAREISR